MSEEKIQNKYIEQDPPLADSPQLERKHNDYLAYLKEKLNFILATYGKRLTSANGDINELQRTAEETSSRISDAEGDISAISQRADSIESSVSNIEGEVSQISQQADNIELSVAKLSSLGGRNYIWAVDPAIHSEVTMNNGATVTYNEAKNGEYVVKATTASSAFVQALFPANTIPVPPELIGEKMTLHADNVTASGTNDPRIYLLIENSGGSQISSTYLSVGELSKTFTVPTGAASFRPLIRVRQTGSTAANESVTVRGIKLEKGEVKTDWSPAPEDSVNGGNIISKINVSSEGITIAANKVDLQGYVTFSNLSTSGQTTINGANITTGLIKDASNKNSWDLNTGAFTITNGSINITTSSSTYDVIKFQNNEWKNAFSPLEYRIWNTNTKKAIIIQAGGQFFYDNYTEGGTNTHVAYIGQTGVHYFNSSGTQTNIVRPAGYVQRNYSPSNASLTMSTNDCNVWDYGRFAIVRLNLNITSGFNAGTLYPLCNIGDYLRSLPGTIVQFVPNQSGTSAALVQIDTDGTLNIYRYSGSGTFTGWLRCMITVPFSNV